ncbi:MAG: UDP-N-acetylmuramate dehydrogenase [Syntrophobacterales bacterium]|nr:MAG: UDP-N-acetylmuramate dehydrogenase [Syntrophobacterales bacterium]
MVCWQMKGDTKGKLKSLIKGKISLDVPMAKYTSLGVGGRADALAFPKDEEDIRVILQFAKERTLPYFILGRGTNVIIRDGGFRGIVISLYHGFRRVKIISRGDEEVLVYSEAGVNLKHLIRFTREKGLTGLEAFIGIPGTLGGALAMNAGAFGPEMKDVVKSVTVMEEMGAMVVKQRKELRFSYRNLVLPKGSIILRAILGVREAKQEEIVAKVKSFQRLRVQSQPWNMQTAGSIFKNPEGTPAGQLIDELGFKGHRIGGARISEKHGNFIVNEGDATAADVLSLMAFVRDTVYEKRGIRLTPEVHIIGEG